MNFPLHKLDDKTEGLLELCQGLDFAINANLGSKWRCVCIRGNSRGIGAPAAKLQNRNLICSALIDSVKYKQFFVS